ncbi:hypothetical protein FAM09_30290 [Niastella caeni]|uniref:Outer membrane protein beta-barrel domain-containing protein n=1 Tax=Niastella caeni TaxID=2569763 RepID=A0A4S8H8X0_9BACT|nr:hypothetical protein [Niastella caeni]THU30449.1 hypothetical protein FAM09_30290 [Niastella caeni]
MKKFVLFLLAGTLASTLWAQTNPTPKSPTAKKDRQAAKRERINNLLKQEEEGEIIFSKQSIFGLKLNTDGYGLSYEIGRFKSARVANIFQLEINEKKHKKEKRTSLLNGFNFNSVIFGKLNNFYQVKLGVGQQRIIGGKGNKNGVAVMAVYTGGLSIGLEKPYYVDVIDNAQQRYRKTYPDITDSGYIEQGASGFTVGWNKVQPKYGLHAKGALRFDYGRFNETISAIEVGLNAEYYLTKVAQMAYNPEKNFFFNAYISLLLGRRKS